MFLRLALCALVFSSLATANEDNEYEGWSDNTYLNEVHHMSCNQSYGNFSISQTDTLYWQKHGHQGFIVTDEHYELKTENGMPNMILTFKSVKEDHAGIYFCHVFDSSGAEVGRTVKGLNVGGHLYDDNIDKYEDNIVVGIIAGASVFVLVVGVCFIERFRYLTDEEKQKRHDQKEERLQRLHRIRNGGQVNDGYENAADVHESKNGNYWNGNQQEANTHL